MPFFIFLFALMYRVYGLQANHPFWVDEFSSAEQAKLILRHGLSVFTNNSIFFESHNITTHALIALSFKLLGTSELAARLPVAIIGAFVPVAVYLVSRKLFGKTQAVVAMILTACSYFEIVWSRQARSYVIVQFLILMTLYLYFSIIEKKRNIYYYVSLLACVALGMLTHFLYYIFILTIPVHALIFYNKSIQWKKVFPFVLMFFAVLFFVSFSFLFQYFKTSFTLTNNLWYYHSFLWREYGLITFLGCVGLVMGFLENRRRISMILLHTLFHLIFILFLFPPYVSRYLLPIFPYLIIGMSYTIVKLAEEISVQIKSFTPRKFRKLANSFYISLIIVLILLANGYKFVNKPKQFYSVNHDFREIALIDYNQIYNLMKEKGKLSEGKTAVIETWDARLYWYLGKNYPARYVFRWQNEKGTVNGLEKQSDFAYNKAGEKVVTIDTAEGFISEVADLKKVLQKYPRGFLLIDDASLPEEVRYYAEKNFKKELYLDHYPLDDNPYSIWPVTLYSWGI